MGDVLEGAGEQLELGIPDQLAEGPVDLEPPAVGRRQGDTDRGMLERAGEAFLAFPQRVFDPLALGDIRDDPGQADQSAGGIADLKAPDANPADLAVRPRDPILDVQARRVAGERREGAQHTLPVLRDGEVDPLLRMGVQALRRTAPDPLEGRTDVVHLTHVR